MADDDSQSGKGALKSGTLQLTKTVESGKVKQSFQHGRSKTVTVEVRTKRTFTPGQGMVEVRRPGQPAGKEATQGERHLTEEERQARIRALKTAEVATPAPTPPRPNFPSVPAWQQERQSLPPVEEKRPEPPQQQRESQQPPRSDRPHSGGPRFVRQPEQHQPRTDRPARPGGDRPRPGGDRPRPAGDRPARPAGATPRPFSPRPGGMQRPVASAIPSKPTGKKPDGKERFSGEEKLGLSAADSRNAKARIKREEEKRHIGKMTVAQALDLDEEQRMRSLASLKRQREKAKKAGGMAALGGEKILRDVIIPEVITVQELANRMAERSTDVIKALMRLGTMVTVNQTIDADTAELIVSEFGHRIKRVTEGDIENILKEETVDPDKLQARAPVVTIMGHVDHGKTSLLDALRSTDVVAGEAGGITQHIGAYQVSLKDGQKITFLDTPGHEAFTAMRARGAKATDIVVLVVAADDGIMEQTKEAINHAKAAAVPIIVAINKIDKPAADPQRVKTELFSFGLVPEEHGGDTLVVEVSAKQKLNLDKLEEAILLQAEVLDLKADPNRQAAGVVVEARMEKGRGVIATLLVQKGTLSVGEIVVAGATYGKVRALHDDHGKMIKEASPSMPVEVLGLSEAPQAGDEFAVVKDERDARELSEYRLKKARAVHAAKPVSLENMFAQKDVATKDLAVIIKADVHGSVEAIAGSLTKLSGEEVAVKVVHSGVGAITESDITLAAATKAIIIGFNVRATAQAKQMAARDHIDIRYYSIIYNVVDEVKSALSGMLKPTLKERFLGYAEIRKVFSVTKAGKVAGCMVTEGIIKRGAKVRLLRDNVVIHEGALKTLKRFKDDVREVKEGFECGMAFENYDDIRENDMIEAFEIEEIARTVD